MARPREFDPEKVLRKVIQVFWERGYDRTSFAQLERATGLKKASLFAAYGDKEALFLKALECYYTDSCRAFTERCGACVSPHEALKSWLLELTCSKDSPDSHRGCFMVNTGIEVAPHNRRCAKVIEMHTQAMETALAELLTRGVQKTEFRRTLDPLMGAHYLLCIASGIHASRRGECSSHRIHGAQRVKFVELILSALR